MIVFHWSRGIQSDCAQFVLMRQDACSLVRATTIPRRREDAEQFPILLNLQLRNQIKKKNYGTKLKSLLTHGPKSTLGLVVDEFTLKNFTGQ